MDDAFVVRVLERMCDLQRQRQGFRERERASRQASRQVFAVDQLHRQEPDPVRGVEAEDGGDVRMVERGQHLRFAFETGETLGIPGEGIRQDLDRHIASQHGVRGAPDDSHAALAERRDELVVGEHPTWREGHRDRSLREHHCRGQEQAWPDWNQVGRGRIFIVMVRTELSLAEETHARLRALARRQGRTISDLVREAIDCAFGRAGDDERARSLRAIEGLWRGRDDMPPTPAPRK